MNSIRWLSILFIFSLTACSSPDNDRGNNDDVQSDKPPREQISILRDQFGTPHIFADSNYGVYFGYGYALAEDRLYQMEILKRTVQGRVSEVLGPEFLDLDSYIRTSYDHPSIKKQLDALPPEEFEILEAYAEGFNRRIAEVMKEPELLPAEFLSNGFMPSQWSALDSAMVFVGSIAHRYSDFNSELDNLKLLQHLTSKHNAETAMQIFNASKWLTDADSPTTVPVDDNQLGSVNSANELHPSWTKLPTVYGTERVAVDSLGRFTGLTSDKEAAENFQKLIASEGFSISPEYTPASNFWGVTHKKAEGANGIFVNGPQFGWSIPSYVYGIGLHGGDFNVVGNTLLGMPCLLFAHNNFVGWGSTAGLSDQVDVYAEQLNPKNSEQYMHKGSYKPFDSWDEVIQVKGADPVTVKARRSVHGMVQQHDAESGIAYTRARAWEGGELQTLMAWINLAKDQTLDAFQKRISLVTTNINFYYMDRQGSIGYTHGGRYPQRQSNHDPRLPADGSGHVDWLGYRNYSENPTTRDPDQGYVANWNNRPGRGWVSSDLWTYTWSRGDRVMFLFDELESLDKLDVDKVWAINERVSYDDVSLPFLLNYLSDAWASTDQSDAISQSLNMLESWDQEWRVDDSGASYGPEALITETWLRHLLEAVIQDDIGSEFFFLYSATNNPNKALGASMGTAPGVKVLIKNLGALKQAKILEYDFFNGESPAALLRKTYEQTIDRLVKEHGTDMQSWVLLAHPMQWKPYNFRGVPQTDESLRVEAPAYMNRGSENNLFVATAQGFAAFDVIPPGQSGHVYQDKSSVNNIDQMEMFQSYKYKEVPFSRQQVIERSVTTKTIGL